MFSQQILTKKVVQYLRQNHSIRLNLPNLFRCIDSKVTLKYLKSFTLNKNQNRYNILIIRIQQLLKKNLLNIQKIKLFSQDFFNTITQDILILQQNQKLKRKIPLAKQQILFKNSQIAGFQQNIKTESLLINDKQDIVNFISNSLKDYLSKLNIIANQYNHVNQFEILTSINIDDLYQDNITNQEDYNLHYTPLLEVLNKLKSNMIKIYQEIQTSDPYDVPLRCVNFLANCKNLIQQMNPFLLTNDSSFNRMIFFVVKCQKQNLQLVASHYQKALVFCRQITSDLFKSYYLGYMFKPSYLVIKDSLQQIRQQLLKLINQQQLQQLKLNQLLKSQINKLQLIRQKIKQLKGIINIGKNGFMKQYVTKKQCKKFNLIQTAQQQYITLRRMIQKFSRYYFMKKQVKKLQNKQIEQSSKIIKQIRILQKINDIKHIVQDNKQRQKITPQKRFQLTFILIQQLILQVSTLKIDLQLQLQTHQDQKNHQLLLQYITHRIQKLSFINMNYLDLQTKLLNTFSNIKTQTQTLIQQSIHNKQNTILNLQSYLELKLNSNLGFIISNQDSYCQQVKAKIMDLGKAQYMIKQWKKDTLADSPLMQTNKKDQDQIKFYRNNLQWLLILFEGSMDQKILQMMMDKLNFESQDNIQKQKRIQQFIKQLIKYINDMKNILRSHPLSQIHVKIYKIIKDRIQLYEIINDIYGQCLLVYRQIKKKDLEYNIQNKGLLLFDQQVFKYVLMVYQFSNKLRMQMSQLKQLMLPSRTKNYLIDQIYQPFAIRYKQYINYKQQQLLNYTLRLQHARNLQLNQNKIINLFQQYITKQYNQEYFNNIQSLCKQFNQIKHENNLVCQLQNQPVVIHNLPKFKQLMQGMNQYYLLAQNILKDIQKNQLQLRNINKLQLKNNKVISFKQIIQQRWKQHYNNVIDIISDKHSSKSIHKNHHNNKSINNNNKDTNSQYNRQNTNNRQRVDSKYSRGSKPNNKSQYIKSEKSINMLKQTNSIISNKNPNNKLQQLSDRQI